MPSGQAQPHDPGATLIALFQPTHLPPMEPLVDVERALASADLELLNLVPSAREDLEKIARLVAQSGAQRLVLVTTHPRAGRPAAAWLPILRAHLSGQGLGCEVLAPQEGIIALVDEAQAIADTRQAVSRLLQDAPGDRSRLRVDISGGTRAMGLGALLACQQAGMPFAYHAAPYDDLGHVLPAPQMWPLFDER